MMPSHLLFAPIVPVWGFVCLALLGLALSAWGWRGGLRAWWRVIPLAVLLLALANPRLTREDATAQDDVAVIMVDDSPSMSVGDRRRQSERALVEMERRLKDLPHLAVKVEHFRPAPGRDEGTRLFGALDRVLADVPRRRLAGVVVISDGQIHDVPAKFDMGVPLHLLLAGHAGERDRRLVVERSPGFGIVGSSASLSFRIEDPGQTGSTDLAIRRDGGAASHVSVPLNRSTAVEVPVEHAGPNIIELEAETVPDELTPVNNRAAVSISGVRDRLRVLLISGEPHAGERTWRNLLKADPSVDLVHFTILRPPEKDDRTPLRELALISFPVRELFEEKLHGFDLIILDRYRRRTVLPPAYYQNIVNYVKGGGALLVAAGPEFVKPDSPYNTPLADILPAAPDGRVIEEPYLPELTDVGHRHPVTAGLGGGEGAPPHWGRWLRLVSSRPKGGGVAVMDGPGGAPLLLLDRVGDGRVAELMSDTVWLWARGWDGGGPQVELTRRLAHWLMKEPELEEEQLTADIRGDRMHVQRRSLTKGDVDVTVTSPGGERRTLRLKDQGDGRDTGEMTIDQAGLWRVEDGLHVALSGAGLLNPIEMSELKATPEKMRPVIEASGGGWRWLDDGLPDVRMVSPDARAAGAGWFGFRANGDKVVTAVHDSPLLPDWLFLVLALGGLVLAWWREGR